MRFLKTRTITNVALISVIAISFTFVGIVKAGTSEPGSEDNPIVAKDYVDAEVSKLSVQISDLVKKVGDLTAENTELTKKAKDLASGNSELLKKIADLEAVGTETTSRMDELSSTVDGFNAQVQNVKFVPVELKKGQQLLAGESAEIILRAGKATAISGTYGGLSDVTAGSGADLATGDDVPQNHLLLISREDGRGIQAETGIWIIIKGTYTIK